MNLVAAHDPSVFFLNFDSNWSYKRIFTIQTKQSQTGLTEESESDANGNLDNYSGVYLSKFSVCIILQSDLEQVRTTLFI